MATAAGYDQAPGYDQGYRRAAAATASPAAVTGGPQQGYDEYADHGRGPARHDDPPLGRARPRGRPTPTRAAGTTRATGRQYGRQDYGRQDYTQYAGRTYGQWICPAGGGTPSRLPRYEHGSASYELRPAR